MARPKKPPKPKVKIKDLLVYLEGLPADNAIREHLTEDKMLRIRKYFDELLFLDHIILGLKDDVGRNGAIEIYVNGSQQTRRTNPALTTFVDVLKVYNALLRQVSEILRGAEIEIQKQW